MPEAIAAVLHARNPRLFMLVFMEGRQTSPRQGCHSKPKVVPGRGEVAWSRRIDPVRAQIQNILFSADRQAGARDAGLNALGQEHGPSRQGIVHHHQQHGRTGQMG